MILENEKRCSAQLESGQNIVEWYFHRESNPDQRFRKPTFYPLNYGSPFSACKGKSKGGKIKIKQLFFVHLQPYEQEE